MSTLLAFSDSTTRSAAGIAHKLPMLQYLIDAASFCNDLKQLQWLHARGAAVSHMTAHCAASAGALDILAWLQQQGVELDERSMNCAASNNHLHVCKWLHAVHCPFGNALYSTAALNDTPEILDWLLANNFPVDADDLCSVVAKVSWEAEDAAMLQVLHKHGLLTDPDKVEKHAEHQWARAEGCTPSGEDDTDGVADY
eukprot:12393-Heterococcus_DN1.PRE.1